MGAERTAGGAVEPGSLMLFAALRHFGGGTMRAGYGTPDTTMSRPKAHAACLKSFHPFPCVRT